MYEKLLSAAGLNEKEALIYEQMLASGQATATQIYRKTPFKRGLVYKLLDQLTEKQLIQKIELPGRSVLFRVEHPVKITELVDNEAEKLRQYQKSIEKLLPQLVSHYNLAFNKPGIQFFEGEEGIKKVIFDTLTAKDVIYTYAAAINAAYIKKRARLGLNKKVIAIDSPFARNFFSQYHKAITDTRFLDYRAYPFSSVMQIYDDKVAYISLSEETHVAVLIADKNIYQMQKTLFEHTWDTAMPYDSLPPLKPAEGSKTA